MNLWRVGLLILLVTILPTLAPAADSGKTRERAALKQQVERLISELDAPTRKERASAERELTKLGPIILPLLPPPEVLRSVAVRETVRRLRIRLEREKAIASVRPAQVTLSGEFALGTILKIISQQTGNRIEFGGLPAALRQQRISVDYDHRNFWPAVDELREQLGIEYQTGAEADRITLVKGGADVPPELGVTYSGPFRIAVTRVDLRPFPRRGPYRIIRVGYRATAEPRLRPLFVQYRGEDFGATSSSGRRLAPFSPDAHPEIPLGEGGRHLGLHCDLRTPADSIPDRLSFRGKLTLTAAAGAEKIEFTRLNHAEGTARRRGGVTVTLEDVELETAKDKSRRARVRVVVAYDVGGPAFESHRSWIFHNRVYLQNAAGRRIERDGVFHTNLQADGAVIVEYGFRKLEAGLDEYRFVYVAPTLLVKLPIEFEFKPISVSRSALESKQP